jgi:hypothetical protein
MGWLPDIVELIDTWRGPLSAKLALALGYMDACPSYDFEDRDRLVLVGTVDRADYLAEALGELGLEAHVLTGSWIEQPLAGVYAYRLYEAMTLSPQAWGSAVREALRVAPASRLEGMLLGGGKLLPDGSAELLLLSEGAVRFARDLLAPYEVKVKVKAEKAYLPEEVEAEPEARAFRAHGAVEVEAWRVTIPRMVEVAEELAILEGAGEVAA